MALDEPRCFKVALIVMMMNAAGIQRYFLIIQSSFPRIFKVVNCVVHWAFNRRLGKAELEFLIEYIIVISRCR